MLQAVLSAVDTGEIYDLIDQVARQTKTSHDTRTMDQRRADALVHLLLGRDPHLGPEDHDDPTTAPDPTADRTGRTTIQARGRPRPGPRRTGRAGPEPDHAGPDDPTRTSHDPTTRSATTTGRLDDADDADPAPVATRPGPMTRRRSSRSTPSRPTGPGGRRW